MDGQGVGPVPALPERASGLGHPVFILGQGRGGDGVGEVFAQDDVRIAYTQAARTTGIGTDLGSGPRSQAHGQQTAAVLAAADDILDSDEAAAGVVIEGPAGAVAPIPAAMFMHSETLVILKLIVKSIWRNRLSCGVSFFDGNHLAHRLDQAIQILGGEQAPVFTTEQGGKTTALP